MDKVAELKKIYMFTKTRSDNFKHTLGDSFTGDELFYLTTKFQSLYMDGIIAPEDMKWFGKLVKFLGPFPVK